MDGNRFGSRETPDATLTAASLIDAIITHQINQPSPHDRQSPVPPSRTGDRLFASFQRPVQLPMNASMHSSQNPPHSASHQEDIKQEDSRDSRPVDFKNPQGDY